MRSNLPIEKLRGRMRSYLGRVPGAEIRDDAPAALVLAPVETGLSQFIKIDDLPDLENLPFVPERMRDFAFRYATEYKPIKFWAREYGVAMDTIYKWLGHAGVRGYIAISRFEQRMFNLAQHVVMQRNVYRTINEILRTRITPDTIESIGKMARFVYEILARPEEAPDRAKGTLNLSIGFTPGALASDNKQSPYAHERVVSPQELKALEDDIVELEIISKGLNGDNGNE